jgi:hypothetical protein
MRLYFENPVGRLLEHPNGYALIQYTPGPRDFGTFKAFLTHTNLLLRRHGWDKLLADQRTMAPFSEAELAWIQDNWLLRTEDGGRELFGAVLIPAEVFAHLAATQDMNDTHQQAALTYRIFQDEATATAWLSQLA